MKGGVRAGERVGGPCTNARAIKWERKKQHKFALKGRRS